MATFLHRLCLFALLTTTGFALSNCKDRMEEQGAAVQAENEAMESEGETMDSMGAPMDAGMTTDLDAGTVDTGMMDGGTPSGSGMGLDAGTPGLR